MKGPECKEQRNRHPLSGGGGGGGGVGKGIRIGG